MARLELTFDDGPGPSTLPLLDVLSRHGARATFFVVGKHLTPAQSPLALRALSDGHRLGNHTLTHRRDPMDLASFVAEVRAVDAMLDALYDRAGRTPPKPHPLRLPYGPLVRDGGVLDERMGYLAALGRTHTHWTGIFDDWEPATTADGLFTALLANVRSHWASGVVPVLCLHDAGTRMRSNGIDRSATVQAVDRLCAALAAEGAEYA